MKLKVVLVGDGLYPHHMELLPKGILALLCTQASINKLLVEAFAEESRNKLLQAVLLEPTCHSYRSAVHLVNETSNTTCCRCYARRAEPGIERLRLPIDPRIFCKVHGSLHFEA